MTISVPQSFKWKRYSVCNLCWLGFHQSFDILTQRHNKSVCMLNNFLKKTNILLRTDHTTQVQRKRAYDDPMLKPPKGRRHNRRWEFRCSSYSLELTCFTSFCGFCSNRILHYVSLFVRVSVSGVTSHISRIYKGINAV